MSDLTSWSQSRLAAIFEAPSADEISAAFDAVIGSNCTVTVNHESSTIDAIRTDMKERRAACASASVEWGDIFIAPIDPAKPDEVCSSSI